MAKKDWLNYNRRNSYACRYHAVSIPTCSTYCDIIIIDISVHAYASYTQYYY